ncbi:hypothetical protein HYW46_07095 [Candidatus Daviesbacteria bacterium]|nr:hypothetical protein [Candidatus Daviesbacteria bacterium]
MTQETDFNTYQSPFSYRYSGPDMRSYWSQANFWRKARNIWLNVAEVQMEAGIVTKEQFKDLQKHVYEISVKRIYELERDPQTGTAHDVMAAIKEFSEKAPLGGKILQQGLTSEDISSNVEIKIIHDSYDHILRPKLLDLLSAYAVKIDRYENLVCMGYTHEQIAEPTTMGYRLAEWAQDLLIDLKFCDFIRLEIKGKGIKGPVGTAASVENALKNTRMSAEELEQKVMKNLGLNYVTIAAQTYPRKYLFLTMVGLASIGASLHRSHAMIKHLQAPWIDEVSEPRRKGTTGSTAMPHKQNPVISENICSLTRELPGKLISPWITSAFVTFERGLEDSAGKKSYLPEAFMTIDDALTKSEKVISAMQVHEYMVDANLKKYAPFCATEIILGELVNAGMDRVEAHQKLVWVSEQSMQANRLGLPINMKELLINDKRIMEVLGGYKIKQAFEDISRHVGNAPQRCDKFLKEELLPVLE